MELARYKLPVLFSFDVFLLIWGEIAPKPSGALNNKAPKELEEKIHPLGVFEGMKVIMSETWLCHVGSGILARAARSASAIYIYIYTYI